MATITSYPTATPTATDTILGNDAEGAATRRFQLDALATYVLGTINPVTTDTTQTITGSKTFSSNTAISSGNLVLSDTGGIVFGTTTTLDGFMTTGTALVSKTLNDYEEGTWTPAISGTTISTSTGRYLKIGRLTTVSLGLQAITVNSGGTTAATITNIPFSGGTNIPYVGSFYYTDSNGDNQTGVASIASDRIALIDVTRADLDGASNFFLTITEHS